MKYLEYTPFESINYFLHHVDLGEYTVQGCLEAYSCKHVGADRKLSASLERELLEFLSLSSENDSSSPTDFLYCRSRRKTLIYLIIALSHIYPDYSFRSVKSHSLFRDEDWESFKQIYEACMYEVEKAWTLINDGFSLLDNIGKAVDEVVKLAECEIYNFHPDVEEDPNIEEGCLWSLHFFFYNSKLRRIVSLRCCCSSKLGDDPFIIPDGLCAEDGDVFDEMDM